MLEGLEPRFESPASFKPTYRFMNEQAHADFVLIDLKWFYRIEDWESLNWASRIELLPRTGREFFKNIHPTPP